MDKKLNQEAYDVDNSPGTAIDVTDNEKVDKKEVRSDVRDLNDNPRNNGNPV